MKLSIKLAAAMTLIATIVLILSDWMALQREVLLIEADRAREVQDVADGLAQLSALASVRDPAQTLDQLDRHIGGMQIRWLPQGTPHSSAGSRFVTDDDGQEFIRATTLVQRPGKSSGVVEVSASMSSRDAFTTRFITKNAVAVILVVIFGGLVALASGHRLVGARVQQLVDKAHRVGHGDFADPLPLEGADELTLLAQSLNEMADQLAEATRVSAEAAQARLQAEVQLRHADRLTTVGQLAAGVAHELGTPLNVISGRARMIQDRSSTERDTRDATTIHQQANRITSIVRRMLDFARKSEPRMVSTDLGRLAQDAMDLLRTMASKAGVDLIVELRGEDLVGDLDPSHIQQVVTNLVINAIHAQPQGGQVRVEVSGGRCDDEEHLHIVVQDRGPGIPEHILDRVFDPFFTTKEPGAGTGLGLSIVHGILTEHGGRVDVHSQPGQGTRFTVHLPRSHRDKEPSA